MRFNTFIKEQKTKNSSGKGNTMNPGDYGLYGERGIG